MADSGCGSGFDPDHELGIVSERRTGVAATIKRSPADFVVEEVAPDGGINSVTGYRPGARSRAAGGHVEFTLIKQRLSTRQAIGAVARELNVPSRLISYAGLKDTKAVTAQAVRIPRRALQRVRELELPGVRLVDPRRVRGRLRTGDLWGNYFCVRAYTATAVTQPRLDLLREELRRDGVPNYFDVQRFGRRRNLHLVGALFAAGDDEAGASRFLFDRSGLEPRHVRTARRSAASCWPDFDAVSCALARSASYLDEELALVRAMALQGAAAVHELPYVAPFSLRAWVSYLFNRAASHAGSSLEQLPFFDGGVETGRLYADLLGWVPVATDDARVRRELVSGARPTRTTPLGCHFVNAAPREVQLSFALEKGAYATSVLRACFDLRPAGPPARLVAAPA